jgi:hypothetical protein
VSEEVLLTQADRGRDVLLVEATPQATRASAALYRRYRRNGSRAAAAEGGRLRAEHWHPLGPATDQMTVRRT